MNTYLSRKTSDFDNSQGSLIRWFILLAFACSVIVLIKLIYAMITGSSLNLVSGSWIGLAMDLSDGVFYRPLFSDTTGFGGTRFFPLYFSFHALLIILSGKPILSGHLVSIFSGLLLFGTCFIMLRQIKVRIAVLFLLLSLLLSTSTIQLGIATIRADILPTAFNILGIVFILSNSKKRINFILASICFTLAFSAKVTAIHGILALFIWMVMTKRIKDALWVLLFTLLGYLLFFCIVYFGTSGKIIDIFNTCASGGADFLTILKVPKRLAVNFIKRDPISLLIALWSFFVVYKNIRKLLTNIFFIYWTIALSITVFIFCTPGTNYNHFVDFTAASILLIGSTWNLIKPFYKKYIFLVCIISAIVFNLYSLNLVFAGKENHLGIHRPKEIVDLIKNTDSIVISEDPMFPILANKNPYLLDPFMLRLIMLKDKEARKSALKSIVNKKYSAILFINDPTKNIKWYTKSHFGSEIVDCILQNYKFALRQGNYNLYVPKSSN